MDAVVADILSTVREKGDAALVELTERFDRLTLTPEKLKLDDAALEDAERQCDADAVAALRLAAERIEAFHRKQLPEPTAYTDAAGVKLGMRWTPVDAAGLYVPGGLATYPSSVLMNAIPAKVAGVERVVMVVPMPDGVVNQLVLAAARIAGVDEVYRIGGRRRLPRWPMAPRVFVRSTKSSVREMPMSRPRSGRYSAPSASTSSRARRRYSSSPMRIIAPTGSPRTCCPRRNTMKARSRF